MSSAPGYRTGRTSSNSDADGARSLSTWRNGSPNRASSGSPIQAPSASSFSRGHSERGLDNLEIVTADVNHFRYGPALRPRGLHRDVRAHEELRASPGENCRPPQARTACSSSTSSRTASTRTTMSPKVPTTGWPATSSLVAPCLPLTLLANFQNDLELIESWIVTGHALREDRQRMAPKDGRPGSQNPADSRPNLRFGGRTTLVGALAAVLHGVRRDVRLPRRRGVARVSPLVPEAVAGSCYQDRPAARGPSSPTRTGSAEFTATPGPRRRATGSGPSRGRRPRRSPTARLVRPAPA